MSDALNLALQQALFDYVEGLGEGGVMYVTTLRDRSLALLQDGNATTIVNTSVNGETYARRADVTAADMFTICQAVLKELRGDLIRMTYPSFRFDNPIL
jgi:hypothetical protein